jgi:hypothetical protein
MLSFNLRGLGVVVSFVVSGWLLMDLLFRIIVYYYSIFIYVEISEMGRVLMCVICDRSGPPSGKKMGRSYPSFFTLLI